MSCQSPGAGERRGWYVGNPVGRVDVGGELYVGVEQGRSRAEKIVYCRACRGSQLKMEDDWRAVGME